MSERFHSFLVVMEQDIHEDDVERVRSALGMIKGVLSVTANVSDHTALMAEDRARAEWRTKMIRMLWPKDST